jgi:hypothetical protein
VEKKLLFSALILVLTGGCPGPSWERVSLVDHRDWVKMAPDDDPFAHERPGGLSCEPEFFGHELFGEESSFGVQTGANRCEWLSVSQKSQVGATTETQAHIRLWHFDLSSPEQGRAHVAIQISNKTVWEKQIDIPAASQLLTESVELTEELEADSPIVFHLHNHGANSWSLLEISVDDAAKDGG